MTLEEVEMEVAGHMDGIVGCFKSGVKITVLVRTPDHPDRDFVMTNDALPDAITALERHSAKVPQSTLCRIGVE